MIVADDLIDTERARRLRDQATRLRRLADGLIEEALVLERGAWGPDPLRGKAIADIAAEVVAEHGALHYTRLTALVEQRAGRRVSGLDPCATLLASINRDDRFMSGGSRSGIYGLRGQARQ